MLKVRKTNNRAEFEYEKLKRFPEIVRPEGLARIAGGYEYDFIVGHTPRYWQSVYDFAIPFWGCGDRKVHVTNYIVHCAEVAVGVLDRDKYIKFNALMEKYIRPENLTYVENCHGDLTFANCIQCGPSMKFIDPGKIYGLRCKELDEAKMLQSICGWEYVRYSLPLPNTDKIMPTSKTTWALLATHLMRLLRHDHPSLSKQWARNWIDRILDTEAKYT